MWSSLSWSDAAPVAATEAADDRRRTTGGGMGGVSGVASREGGDGRRQAAARTGPVVDLRARLGASEPALRHHRVCGLGGVRAPAPRTSQTDGFPGGASPV